MASIKQLLMLEKLFVQGGTHMLCIHGKWLHLKQETSPSQLGDRQQGWVKFYHQISSNMHSPRTLIHSISSATPPVSKAHSSKKLTHYLHMTAVDFNDIIKDIISLSHRNMCCYWYRSNTGILFQLKDANKNVKQP